MRKTAVVDHIPPAIDQNPSLAYSSDDHERVSVAFARALPDPDQNIELHHATLLPWQNWPADALIQQSFTTSVSSTLSSDFRVGQGNDGHIGLLVAHTFSGGSFPAFAPFVDASSTNVGPNVTLNGAEPGFVTRGRTNFHLVGTLQAGTLVVSVVTFDGAGFGSVTSTSLGCSAYSIVADAAPYQGGWLVAVSDAVNGVNGCSGVDPGPPTHIDIAYVGTDGIANNLTTFDTGGIVQWLRVAPAPAGIDVVYKSGVFGPIERFRVEPPSPNIIGPSAVTSPGEAPFSGFAAAALGDQLAVVWSTDTAVKTSDIVLTLLDVDGAHVAETWFEPGPFLGNLSALGSPNADSVVIAYQVQEPVGANGAAAAVQLERLDCVGAP